MVQPVRVQRQQRPLERCPKLGFRELTRRARDDIRRGRNVDVAKQDRADLIAVDLDVVDAKPRRRRRAPGAEADEGAILQVQLGVESDDARISRRQLRLDQCDVIVEPVRDYQDGPRTVLMLVQRGLGTGFWSSSVSVPTY